MCSRTDSASGAGELPPLPADTWRGDHLRETRWQLELYRLLVDPVLRGSGVPHGDGRPMVLMPGFGGGDQTLLVLAAWLRRIGYRPSTCGFVVNTGCGDRALERVERRVEQLYAHHGRRVALIGHSRGGHYARASASVAPSSCRTRSRWGPACVACSPRVGPPSSPPSAPGTSFCGAGALDRACA